MIYRYWSIGVNLERMLLSKCSYSPLKYSVINKRYASAMTKTKSLLGCGFNVVKNKYNAVIHGPTADEVIKDLDLSGKNCLITGANSGIGLEMTRCLSSRNCTVLMACRNTYAASIAAKHMCEDNGRVRVYETNLASLKSVKRCSEDILKNHEKLDLVILNAGVFGLPWTLTEDNLETSFQVNYLSQYYLLMNIEKILASDARVVFVSSESHRNVNWSRRDQLMPTVEMLSLEKNQYTSIKAYNVSKLCGVLTMYYLGYRWLKTAKSIFCAHPGSFVKTRLCRNWWPYEALYTLMLPFSKTISQAASTPLYCATSPELCGHSSCYYKDCRRVEAGEMATDFHLAFRINDLSQELIRERVGQISVEEPKTEIPTLTVTQTKEVVDDTLSPSYST